MAFHAFPLSKLVILLTKQIVNKPIGRAVRAGAKNSPMFMKYVCLPPAKVFNWIELRTKLWMSKMGHPVTIKIRNETSAVDLAANMLAEVVIFSIGVLIIVVELGRASRKNAKKEALRSQDVRDLRANVKELLEQTSHHTTDIRELFRRFDSFSSRGPVEHPKEVSATRRPPPREPILLSSSPTQDKQNSESRNLVEESTSEPMKGVIFKALNDVEHSYFPWKKST